MIIVIILTPDAYYRGHCLLPRRAHGFVLMETMGQRRFVAERTLYGR